MEAVTHPGSPTAFEDLVDVYDAARPRYPAELYDALVSLTGSTTGVLELGAGTGIATRRLAERFGSLVSTDLGPRMLRRLHERSPRVPVAVCRAEQLPFADGSFDLVCGAHLWHWVDLPRAIAEVLRVLRPGGALAVWWNEVEADGLPWWDAQQDRLEAMNPAYRRGYRTRDHAGDLAPFFAEVRTWSGTWTRELDWPTYEQWLRSKSYVQAIDDLDGFLGAARTELAEAFPDGRIVEPFRTSLWVARR